MGNGWVLDFSNNTFASCIFGATNIDIYDAKYAARGTSKACRLRLFWDIEPDSVVVKVLEAMLEVMDYNDEKQGKPADTSRYERLKKIIARLSPTPTGDVVSESAFLQKNFGTISLRGLPVDASVIPILENRIAEVEMARKAGASLSVIFLCGSVLEGVLLGTALHHPKEFNQSTISPKDKEGKVKAFQDWKLCHLIDVASDVGLLGLDVKKFSHSLREFRNYIHPYQQLASRFEPSRHTAEICYQVMKACIAHLVGDNGK